MAYAFRYLISLLRDSLSRASRGLHAGIPGGALRVALFALLLAVSGITPKAYAQQSELKPVRFTVFSTRPIGGLEFSPRPGAAPQKVVFYPTARSPRYEFRGAMPIEFRHAADGEVVAEARVPPQLTDVLLLFIPLDLPPGAGIRYQVAVLDDSATRHGAGSLAVINLSGLALSGVVGPHAVILREGLNPVLHVGTSAQISLRAALKERTYQSLADQLEMGTNERALLILFPPYYPGSVEVQSRMLIDRPPAAGPAPPRG